MEGQLSLAVTHDGAGCCQSMMTACGCMPGSKRPRNVVPLSHSEGKVVFEALQGSWSIKAIAMSDAMQKLGGGNQYVTPISFNIAVVAGMRYTMSGAGQPHTETFEFSKSPDTGQIFLDTWGSIIATQGWPNVRPMAGEKGEVIDFVTPFAAIRWTRTDAAGTAAAFGQVQTRQPQAATGGGAAEVTRLMQLRDQGVLSEDEFQSAKRKALGI